MTDNLPDKSKNALIIYAHADLKSFSGSLLDVTCDTLKRIGYEVDVSDLYSEYVEPSLSKSEFAGILESWLDLILSSIVKYPYPVLNPLEDGPMKGKRTVLSSITDQTVSQEDINLILWSVQNNLLRGCGFDVLRPQCSQLTRSSDGLEEKTVLDDWKNRLENIESDEVNSCLSMPDFPKWMKIKRTDKLKETKRQESIERFTSYHMQKRVTR